MVRAMAMAKAMLVVQAMAKAALVVVVSHIRTEVPGPMVGYCRLAKRVPLGPQLDIRFHQLIRVRLLAHRLDRYMRKSQSVDRHFAGMFLALVELHMVAEVRNHSAQLQMKRNGISTEQQRVRTIRVCINKINTYVS